MSHVEEGYGTQRKLLTREEVAEQLGVSPRTVARLAERGDLAYVRLGRLARFRPADVTALVDARLNKEAPVGTGALSPSHHQEGADSNGVYR